MIFFWYSNIKLWSTHNLNVNTYSFRVLYFYSILICLIFLNFCLCACASCEPYIFVLLIFWWRSLKCSRLEIDWFDCVIYWFGYMWNCIEITRKRKTILTDFCWTCDRCYFSLIRIFLLLFLYFFFLYSNKLTIHY